MSDEWTLRQKHLLWYYFQELRVRGKYANDTSKTSLYRDAAKKAAYKSVEYAARVIRAMMEDKNVWRYIDTIGSIDDIE